MSVSVPSQDTSILGSPGHEKRTALRGGLGWLVGIERAVQQMGGVAAGALLVALLGLVSFSFLSRTMGWTTTFSEEFTRYTVTAIFSLSVGYTALHGKHVCTDVAVLKLSSARQRAIAIVVDLINLATFGFFAVSAHAMWQLSYQWGMRSGSDIAFPIWIVQGLFYASFFLLIARAFIDLVVDVFAWDAGDPHEEKS